MTGYIKVYEHQLIEKPIWWQLRGLSFTASGYGKKIPTSKMVKVDGRLYRIYCAIFSNCGMNYIVKGKQKLVIDII